MRETTLDALCALLREGRAELRADSRLVAPGDIFVALPGSQVDGADYTRRALEAGAAAIVSRTRPAADGTDGDALLALVTHPAEALGLLAAARYGTEGDLFPVFGVTGTNGKTTVTYLLEHLFRVNGKKTGVLGTVSYRWPGHEEDAPLTTPDTLRTHAMLGAMRAAGVEAAFMEVSSHALDQDRVAGVPFAGAAFTNLTQDHLDYHKDMETYFAAKARLFTGQSGIMVINADDPWGCRLLNEVPRAVSYGLRGKTVQGRTPHLLGEVLANTPGGLRLALEWHGARQVIASPLIGLHNAENLLAAMGLALGYGFDLGQMDAFGDFYGVCGRLERVRAMRDGQELHVFVDYAHTPDALINVLHTLRGVGFTRIITVFGCGGNRDRAKRPLMGEAVARLADVAVLTSDNPRHEDPLAIMGDVMPGLRAGGGVRICAEPDRRAAIKMALDMAGPGDVVLIAGKGHERTQQVGDVKHPFSDQQVVRELLPCA